MLSRNVSSINIWHGPFLSIYEEVKNPSRLFGRLVLLRQCSQRHLHPRPAKMVRTRGEVNFASHPQPWGKKSPTTGRHGHQNTHISKGSLASNVDRLIIAPCRRHLLEADRWLFSGRRKASRSNFWAQNSLLLFSCFQYILFLIKILYLAGGFKISLKTTT